MAKNVTVEKIIAILLQRIKFIVLATILAGALFFMYSKFIITPYYNTSAMIYIQNYSNDRTGTINDQNKKLYTSDFTGSAALAEICVTLFTNSDDITSLYDGCDVTMKVNEDTFFVTIDVNGPDPQKCANVANQVVEEAKKVFSKYFKFGQIDYIREAKVPQKPYEPNNLKNALIGLVVGLAISCIISILLDLIDTTIKTEDDIQAMYNIPVFAEIPDFENSGR